jgi:zinc protease
MRRTFAAGFFVLALAAPRLEAQTPPPLQIDYTQFDLPNGLHVILHEDHSVPVVTVNTWYHVGSARERTGRTGFAHLFEHLMFMGSGHVKPGQFDEWLENVGGTNNGSTTSDRTNYFITWRCSSNRIAWGICSIR